MDTFVEFPDWIKNKKCAINPQNKNDNRCFQYSVTAALNYQKISNNPERILKIKPFTDQYNWNEINFPPQEQDYITLEMKNKSITLNVLCVQRNTEVMSTSRDLIKQENIK